jgi:4-hydroxybenzoate polyprenyltransferase
MLRSDEHPVAAAAGASARLSFADRLRAHVAIMRPDHWFKNVFMLVGVLVAFFYHPGAFCASALGHVLLGLASVCLIASSNYVLNEILDAPTDRSHFVKRHRPIPSGRVWVPAAYAEWLALGGLGLLLAALENLPFLWSAATLLAMGLVYNVPPVRSKDVAYVDVLSESINNPLRLALGWFTVVRHEYPPLCLLLVYWMIGAFFMASKRFAEYRSIGDPEAAAAYRKSFAHYDEEKLLVTMFFYAVTFALFLGIFTIRYHIELVLIFPLATGFVCHYLHVAFKKDSACQSPERLYRERGLMAFLALCLVSFVVLMFVHIPLLYTLFNVTPSPVSPLWTF